MFAAMENNASKLINAFGGTSATARLAGLPISTVHSWRANGIPESRLSHLRLVAKLEKPELDFDALAVGVTPAAIAPTPTDAQTERAGVGKVAA